MKIRSLILGLAGSVAFATAANATSLISNGDFDLVDSTPGQVNQINLNNLADKQWDVYTTLPGGWYSTGSRPKGVEIQRNTIVEAHSGEYYIELESHPKPSASNVSQKVNVTSAGSYKLSFWYQPRTNSPGDNLVRALMDGIVLTTVSGPDNPPLGRWTQVFVTVLLGVGTHTLTFDAFGTKDNTLGGFVDTVELNAVVPVPATLPLLLTGLAGLGFLARRRNKSA